MGKILLREFMQRDFSLAKLNSFPTLNGIKQYCDICLGEPIGEGSDRIVYEIGDGEVIKIAKSQRACLQNKQEYINLKSSQTQYPFMKDMFPRIYQVDGQQFRWITCERVLELTKEDCEEVLHMKYFDLLDFIDYVEGKYMYGNETINDKFEELISKNQWFHNIAEYIKMTPSHCTDLTRENLGLILRNNKPFIVILDSGMDAISN